MRALIVVAWLAALAACKTDKPEVKPKQGELVVVGSGSTATTVGPIEGAQPELEGGSLLQVRTRTETQMTSHWCVADAKGREAVAKVADTLRRDGWGDVSTRGAADRFAVAGRKADLSVSAMVGGRDPGCTSGTLVIMTIVRLPSAVAPGSGA